MMGDSGCTRCRLHKTADEVCVLGSGDTSADIMIIGEAPRKQGASWQVLESELELAGIRDYYYATAVACLPDNDRAPTKAEVRECRHWLNYQIEKVKPSVILLLGNTALKSVLDVTGIKKLRGKPIEIDEGNIIPAFAKYPVTVVPTFSPALVLREESNRAILRADINLLSELDEYGGIPEVEGLNKREVLTEMDILDLLDALEGTVSFDLETTCLYPWAKSIESKYYTEPQITALGFDTGKTQWTIPFFHYEMHPFSAKRLKRLVRQIDRRLRDCFLVAHNGKFDSMWMEVMYGVHWTVDFDTMLAHYLIDENSRHGLKHLSQVYFGAMDYDLDPVDAPWDKLAHYHCLDVLYTRKLRYKLGKQLNRERAIKKLFYKLMMPINEMFLNAQINGVHIDITKFDEAEEYLRGEIAEALEDLNEYDSDINWGSPKQLAALLFDEDRLGLKPLDLTGTGKPSTSESVLKRLDHPIGRQIIRLRGARQQLSFFIEGWKPYLDDDNRLHPSFKLHGAVTGRPSCANPNLQQTPRDPRIRSLISAPPGWALVECDLSQVELRVAAELSGEPTMMDTFYKGKDIHWQTAIREIARSGGLADQVITTGIALTGNPTIGYGDSIQSLIEHGHKAAIDIDGGWKDHRKKAKAINFGYLYGMWWKKFIMYARDNYGVIVDEKQAQASRKAFFELYPGLVDWHKRQKNFARRNGYVTTLTGRKRRLPQAQLPYDCPQRKEAQRQAINSPVQGFAAEVNLMAGLQLCEEFSRDIIRVIGTIHDAVLFWSRIDHVHKTVPRMLEIMTRPAMFDDLGINLRVPLLAEAEIGPWSQGKELEEWLSSSK